MNEKVKELANKVVEVVGEMKISEIKNDWAGRTIMDFYDVSKRIIEGHPMDLSICGALNERCEKKQKAKKSKAASRKSAKKADKSVEVK